MLAVEAAYKESWDAAVEKLPASIDRLMCASLRGFHAEDLLALCLTGVYSKSRRLLRLSGQLVLLLAFVRLRWHCSFSAGRCLPMGLARSLAATS